MTSIVAALFRAWRRRDIYRQIRTNRKAGAR